MMNFNTGCGNVCWRLGHATRTRVTQDALPQPHHPEMPTEGFNMNIIQDAFSSSFTKTNQLNVLGLVGDHAKQEKIYAVTCDVCSSDSEMYGDGIFTMNKARIAHGGFPCGCSKSPKLTLDQHIIRASRTLTSNGYRFVSAGDWIGNKTSVIAMCDRHGEYETSFDKIQCGYRCSKCAGEARGDRRSVSPERMIERCNRIGLEYVRRSDRRDANGSRAYSIVRCAKCSSDEYVVAGLCDGYFESLNHEIAAGKMPCRCSHSKSLTYEQMCHKISSYCDSCGIYEFDSIDVDDYAKNKTMARIFRICSKHGKFSNSISNVLKNSSGCPMCSGGNQKQSYINIVSVNGVDVAAKFGIAANYMNRIHAQNRYVASVRNIFVFEFDSIEDCRAAERECKRTFKRGVVSKSTLSDGYTETVDLSKINSMKEIFIKHGGIIIGGD